MPLLPPLSSVVCMRMIRSTTKDKVWVKVVKSATIQGYLVTPEDCCCT